jgi:hypothetical protein
MPPAPVRHGGGRPYGQAGPPPKKSAANAEPATTRKSAMRLRVMNVPSFMNPELTTRVYAATPDVMPIDSQAALGLAVFRAFPYIPTGLAAAATKGAACTSWFRPSST